MVVISFYTQNVPWILYFEQNKANLVFMTLFFDIFVSNHFRTNIFFCLWNVSYRTVLFQPIRHNCYCRSWIIYRTINTTFIIFFTISSSSEHLKRNVARPIVQSRQNNADTEVTSCLLHRNCWICFFLSRVYYTYTSKFSWTWQYTTIFRRQFNYCIL